MLILVYPVDFAANIPSRFAQVLQCFAFEPGAPQVFNGVADTEVKVFCNLDALNQGRMTGVVRRMVYWVHPYNLAYPAWLSNLVTKAVSLPFLQVPLFHADVVLTLSQALPAHHPATCWAHPNCYSPLGISPA